MGRHLAQRLVADGETVLDVPAKLAARARVFSTGQGRKTDATDAHSVAVVALRTPALRPVRPDDRTVALRLLADRRDELGAARTLTINRLHRLLVELVPGGAKKALTAGQARALLDAVPAGDVVAETRRVLAAELVDELDIIDARIKTANSATPFKTSIEACGTANSLPCTELWPTGRASIESGAPSRRWSTCRTCSTRLLVPPHPSVTACVSRTKNWPAARADRAARRPPSDPLGPVAFGRARAVMVTPDRGG